MKKVLFAVAALLLVGCELSNTPTRQVEALMKKYQTLDNSVLTDLDVVIKHDEHLEGEQEEKYRDIMKKHYQNLIYEIKDEVINGDEAVVKVEITVTDFNKVLDEANRYLVNNPKEFNDENGNYDAKKYMDYRLEQLKQAKDKVKYTLEIPVNKIDDNWKVSKLDDDTLKKINGVYNY